MLRLRRATAFAVPAVAIAITAAACGSSGSTATSGNTPSASSGGSSSAATGGGTASGQVALLLPENDTARYESADRPYFTAALKQMCPSCTLDYSNAANSSSTQLQQANAALTKGAKVLVLDPVDGTTAGAIVSAAKAKNVPVISYDRLITGGGALPTSYISFDNTQVGVLQGKALLAKLQANGKKGQIAWINGSPTDNNATLFKMGAHSVIPTGGVDGYTIGYEIATPDWLPATAQTEMSAAISKIGKANLVGVYSANDGMAATILAAMQQAGISPIPPMTGQDSQADGINRILLGQQYMDIYKAIKPEATDAAELATDYLKGNTSPTTVGGVSVTQTKNGTSSTPSVLLQPVVVTKDNIKSTVIASGFLTAAQVCNNGAAAECKTLGIS